MACVLATPSRPLTSSAKHLISMEIDFPMSLQCMERVDLIRNRVSANMNDMYKTIGTHLPLMWYMHIDDFPLMWSLDAHTLRVRINATVCGLY